MTHSIAYSQSSSISGVEIPHFNMGVMKIKNRHYSIAPLLVTDRKDAIQFLTDKSKLYAPFDRKYSVQRIDEFISRHIKGVPWSAYVVRNELKHIVGLWTIAPISEPKILQVIFNLHKESEKMGITQGMWDWTKDHLLPTLSAKQVRVPFFKEQNQEPGSIPMKEAVLQVIHPNDEKKHGKILNAGFRQVGQIGTFLNQRNIYQLPLAEILK